VRVIVTRAAGQEEPLASRVRELGHEVVICPLVRVEPVGPDRVELEVYDWLLVTSANAARELAHRASGRPGRTAAIGPGTADALLDAGFRVDLVPAVSTQEGLLAELPRPPGRVLFAGAVGARRLLADELEADFVPLYRTVELRPEVPPGGDVAVLASPSAARAFAALALGVPAVVIGPETARAARAAGLRIAAEATTHDLDGLVTAIASVVNLPSCSSPS